MERNICITSCTLNNMVKISRITCTSSNDSDTCSIFLFYISFFKLVLNPELGFKMCRKKKKIQIKIPESKFSCFALLDKSRPQQFFYIKSTLSSDTTKTENAKAWKDP